MASNLVVVFFSVQAQISGVTDAMRDNVGRLLERGDQLDQLSTRSEHLASTADSFRTSAVRLRRNVWWQNTKGRLVIGGGLVLLLVIVFGECGDGRMI